jgi:hypothetical protein
MTSPLIDFFANLGFWNWFFLAIILFALETFVPGVHFLWFGLAATIVGLLVTGAIGLGYSDLFSWPLQLVAFATISVLTVFCVKTLSKSDAAKSDEPNLNIRGAQYIGRTVTVENAIKNGRGKVRVGDTLWNAEGEEAASGTRVRVTGVNGTALVVERLGD